MDLLLAVDVGNTNVTAGAFEGGRLKKLWRLATDARKTADEYGASLAALVSREGKAADVVYGSVVPALSPVIEAACREYLGIDPLAVTPASPLGIRLDVDNPAEVGVDRVLNALAARALYGAPAIVIDFGTATTFDCVSPSGDYMGGAILIGPAVAALALREHTAQLPKVEIRKPAKFIGKNTAECIQAGLYHGYLGMIERVLDGTLREMKQAAGGRVRVIATGGLAGLFARDIPRIGKNVPDLTLHGLRLAREALRDSRVLRK